MAPAVLRVTKGIQQWPTIEYSDEMFSCDSYGMANNLRVIFTRSILCYCSFLYNFGDQTLSYKGLNISNKQKKYFSLNHYNKLYIFIALSEVLCL